MRSGRLQGRAVLAAASIGAMVALAGCTSSLGDSAIPNPYGTGSGGGAVASADVEQYSLGGAEPTRGSGTVDVVVPTARPLSDSLVKAVKAATGYSVAQQQIDLEQLDSVAKPSGVDLVVGFDGYMGKVLADSSRIVADKPAGAVEPEGTAVPEAPGAVAFARDDVCAMADAQWFAANKAAMPATLDDLSRPEFAKRLWMADPVESSSGRTFVQATGSAWGDQAGAKWAAIVLGGATIGKASEAAAVDTILHDHSLVIASRANAAATMKAGDSENASWQGPVLTPIEDTCIQRPLYAAVAQDADNADGATAVVNYLQSGAGQHDIADAGTGYAVPLAPGAADGTLMGQFITPLDQQKAIALPAESVAKVPAYLDAWKAATKR